LVARLRRSRPRRAPGSERGESASEEGGPRGSPGGPRPTPAIRAGKNGSSTAFARERPVQFLGGAREDTSSACSGFKRARRCVSKRRATAKRVPQVTPKTALLVAAFAPLQAHGAHVVRPCRALSGTLSAPAPRCPLLSAPGIPLPKLNVAGSSPVARSTQAAITARG
jgi:hypothetical protein